MKNRKEKQQIRFRGTLTAAAIILTVGSVLMVSGCTKPEKDNSAVSRETSSVVSENSSAEQKTESVTDEKSDAEIESSIGTEISEDQPSETESSVAEGKSSETTENSKPSEEESTENPSGSTESSFEGYQFDDEDIVTDYHTATEFTSDEGFNHIFDNNNYDKDYNHLLMDASATSEMRKITAEYSQKWQMMSDSVYKVLSEKLSDNQTEKQKLEDSQESWKNNLKEVESSFYKEAEEGGSDGLLAAEGAVMNYYKGRAAVLLQQIYVLQGNSIELSDYGL